VTACRRECENKQTIKKPILIKMEIRGKIIAVLPVKDGIGKTSGNEWKSREFVLETEESKPQSVCLQLMNANIERYAVEVGMTVHVKFDISARQWENRWFNTLTAWEVTVIKQKEEQPA